MEVHHHSHTERKKWRHYLWEFLMLFLAVTLGFFVENWREHIVEGKRAKELAESLYKEVYADSVIVRQSIENRLKIKEANLDHFIDYVRDSSITNLTDGVYSAFFTGFLINYRFEPKDGILSQLRNSGSLRYFKSIQLQEEIGQFSVAIAEVRTRNGTERDFIASTAMPLMINHFDFSWFRAFTQHSEGQTKEEEQFEEKRPLKKPEILNPSQFNKQEAVNIANYNLMLLRGTRKFQYKNYADINHQLLETLRKEYDVKNE